MDPARLRSSTETEHRTLEAELHLLRPSLTREEYAELLVRFHAFYSRWEKAAEEPIDSVLPGFFGPRRKVFRLEADLRALNYSSTDLLHLARLVELPKLDSPARVLGSMYVIEGSTLGGQILARHFTQQLGIDRESGCSFFSGYGERTSQMWREFRDVVAQRPAAEDEEMIDSAVATFRAMRAWLIPRRAS